MKKELIAILCYIVINGFVVFCIYQWLHNDSQGFYNLLCGYTVIAFVMSLSALIAISNEIVLKAIAPKYEESIIPRWIDVSYDLIIISFLFYGGSFIIAFLYFMHMIFLQIGISAIESRKKEIQCHS